LRSELSSKLVKEPLSLLTELGPCRWRWRSGTSAGGCFLPCLARVVWWLALLSFRGSFPSSEKQLDLQACANGGSLNAFSHGGMDVAGPPNQKLWSLLENLFHLAFNSKTFSLLISHSIPLVCACRLLAAFPHSLPLFSFDLASCAHAESRLFSFPPAHPFRA
jgi:hypothetical protein